MTPRSSVCWNWPTHLGLCTNFHRWVSVHLIVSQLICADCPRSRVVFIPKYSSLSVGSWHRSRGEGNSALRRSETENRHCPGTSQKSSDSPARWSNVRTGFRERTCEKGLPFRVNKKEKPINASISIHINFHVVQCSGCAGSPWQSERGTHLYHCGTQIVFYSGNYYQNTHTTTPRECNANFLSVHFWKLYSYFLFQNADVIVYVENGKVQESGSHQELIARKGKYYQLMKKQDLNS